MDGQPPSPPSDSSSSRSDIFLAATVIMLLLLIVTGAFLLAAYMAMQPPLPIFQLTSLSLTNISSSPSLTATCHLSFLSRTRQRKVTATFKAVHSTISHADITLADSRLAPFMLDGAKSETALNATLNVAAATYAVQAAWLRGTVTLDVHLEASGSSRYGWWPFRERTFKVSCRQVPVGISPVDAMSGHLVGGTRDCDVCTETKCLDSKGWVF